MKNLLNRIHTRWMRRRLALAMADLAWMRLEYPRNYARQRRRVVEPAAAVAISSSEVARSVEQRAKQEVLCTR